GGSTITQQYVKNVYTGDEQDIRRKIQEAVYAVRLEQHLSKDQILQDYLNTIYFGNGAYGVETAAETYFGIPASKLNPAQAATLAAMIPAPAAFDPYVHPKAAKGRRNYVLEQMAQQHYLSPTKAARLERRPLGLTRAEPTPGTTSYFLDDVRQR